MITRSISLKGIELAFSKVKSHDKEGKEITVGKLSLDPVNNTKLLLPLEGELAKGRELLCRLECCFCRWAAKQKGSYQFSVK